MAGSKGKRGSTSTSSKSDFSSWRGPWCVLLLHQGEKGVPVLEYLKQFGPDIIQTDPTPGEASSEIKGSLIGPAKEVVFKLIAMVFRELEDELYFTKLDLKNIFVTDHTNLKIRDGIVIKTGTSGEKKEENVYALAQMIEDLVTATSPSYAGDSAVNPELKHLLSMMRAYKYGKSTYLIRYHPCNVPDHSRGFYSIVIHDETMDVIRYPDAKGFHYIIDGVEVPADYLTQMEKHAILKKYVARGHYATAGGVPKLVPIKCLRNIPGDPNGPFFTRGDMARFWSDQRMPIARGWYGAASGIMEVDYEQCDELQSCILKNT